MKTPKSEALRVEKKEKMMCEKCGYKHAKGEHKER